MVRHRVQRLSGRLLSGRQRFKQRRSTLPRTNPTISTSRRKFQTPKFDLHQFNTNLHPCFVGHAGWNDRPDCPGDLFRFRFRLHSFCFTGWRTRAFMFLDNIVRNRGAISWPWHNYARQANSLFVFYLLFMVITFAIILPIIVRGDPDVHSALPASLAGGRRLPALSSWGCSIWPLRTVISFILFVFREFGVPLMFRNGLAGPRRRSGETMNLVGDIPAASSFSSCCASRFSSRWSFSRSSSAASTCCLAPPALYRDGYSPARADLCALLHPRLPRAIRAGVRCLDRRCAAVRPGQHDSASPPRHHPDKFDPVAVLEACVRATPPSAGFGR